MRTNSLYQWDGCSFYCNLSEKDFLFFRETGYASHVLKKLDARYKHLYVNYDVYVLFRLVEDQTEWIIPKFSKPLILFIIGHEHGEIPNNVVTTAAIIFKQYLSAKYSQCSINAFRIPVGPSYAFKPQACVPFNERLINVFFAGNLHLGRAHFYRALTGVYLLPFFLLHRLRMFIGTNFNALFPRSTVCFSDGFHNGLPAFEYSHWLGNSKIVLCPYGLSEEETMRHFEAMQCGCVVVTDRMPSTFYFKGAPFVVIPKWKGLKNVVQGLLDNEEALQRLHQETIAWWEQKCSVNAVADYIYQKIKQVSHLQD